MAESFNEHPGPSPKLFALATLAVLVLLVGCFYLLGARFLS